MRVMIIHTDVAPTHMRGEDSEIYIGKQSDGTIITVFEYVTKVAEVGHSIEIFCPSCAEEGENQRLTYLAEDNQFVHHDVSRNCYQDHRTHDPDHPVIQQTVFKWMNNSSEYSDSEIEFALTRRQNDNKLWYDIGGNLPHDDGLTGALIEVQHQSGRFSSRLYPRVKLAHWHNYGVYIIFTPTAKYRQWLKKRLIRMKGYTVQLGSISYDTVNFGTMIRPGDDITVLQT